MRLGCCCCCMAAQIMMAARAAAKADKIKTVIAGGMYDMRRSRGGRAGGLAPHSCCSFEMVDRFLNTTAPMHR